MILAQRNVSYVNTENILQKTKYHFNAFFCKHWSKIKNYK